MEKAKVALGNAGVYVNNSYSLVEAIKAVVIATAWPQYEELNYTNTIVIDGRRIKKQEKQRHTKE
jgi:UDP-glucose 6-dehydrogenase